MRTIRKAEAGSQELLDSIEEGMRLGLDQKIDDVLDKRERELVRRGREPRIWAHRPLRLARKWDWLQRQRVLFKRSE